MKPAQNIFTKFSIINGVSYLALNYELFELNDVGQFIWESIDGAKDIENITELVAVKYSVDVEVVEEDVQEFLNGLINKGLAEV